MKATISSPKVLLAYLAKRQDRQTGLTSAIWQLSLLVLLHALILAVTGCQIPSSSYRQIRDGYLLKKTKYFPGIDTSVELALYFKPEVGHRTLVWTYFNGPAVITNGTAIFESQDRRADFYAVYLGGTVLKLTDDILLLHAETTGRDPGTLEGRYSPYDLVVSGQGVVTFDFAPEYGINQPHLYVPLTWTEVTTIMRRVQAGGTERKDSVGRSFLEIQRSRAP